MSLNVLQVIVIIVGIASIVQLSQFHITVVTIGIKVIANIYQVIVGKAEIVVGRLSVAAVSILVAYPSEIEQQVFMARGRLGATVNLLEIAVQQFSCQFIVLVVDKVMRHSLNIILFRREVFIYAGRHIIQHKLHLGFTLHFGIEFIEFALGSWLAHLIGLEQPCLGAGIVMLASLAFGVTNAYSKHALGVALLSPTKIRGKGFGIEFLLIQSDSTTVPGRNKAMRAAASNHKTAFLASCSQLSTPFR